MQVNEFAAYACVEMESKPEGLNPDMHCVLKERSKAGRPCPFEASFLTSESG